MRALLRPLSHYTVFSPIETIVAIFVLATLAYFHILDGIKHSSFFAPTFPSTLRPASARLSQGEWLPISEREWYNAWKRGDEALELQQLVFSLEDKGRKVSITHSQNHSPFATCNAFPAWRPLGVDDLRTKRTLRRIFWRLRRRPGCLSSQCALGP